jgi:hypothetical protein
MEIEVELTELQDVPKNDYTKSYACNKTKNKFGQRAFCNADYVFHKNRL